MNGETKNNVHGGDESELTPEQRAESRKNNSREAFERLAKSDEIEQCEEAKWILTIKGNTEQVPNVIVFNGVRFIREPVTDQPNPPPLPPQ